MKTIQLLNYPIEEFMKEMEVMVDNLLTQKLSKQETRENRLLTREETSKLLSVSLTTLFHWNNNGILKAQKLGKRVYYQRDEVLKHLSA